MARIRRIAALLLLALGLLLGLSGAPQAATAIEKLMMPGELSLAHVKQEEDCANCHKVLQRQAQSSLCLACHKTIQADVNAKTGFHGKDLAVSKSECFSCHAEHKGRDFKLIQFEPVVFDHKETNYPLDGAHKDAACASCHKDGKKYREAPKQCFDCHASVDMHKGALGKACETCHTTETWAKQKDYDHDKTRFPLRGAHLKAQCISCHVGEIYKPLSTACNDCHAISDVHGRKFGVKCEECHSVDSWKTAKFDHNKLTHFALDGAHAKAQCSDCHGEDVRAKIETACISCHKEQDVHKGELGQNCQQCHGTSAWKQDIRFDHGLTSYPLTGLHIVVACEGCHASQATYKQTPTACLACHAKDDKHEGRFAMACESCHSTLGWKRVVFDHGKDANYPLTGAHANTACYDCHATKNVKSAKLPTDCYACHKAQDVHHGAFGTNCAKCHTTATFKTAFIRQ